MRRSAQLRIWVLSGLICLSLACGLSAPGTKPAPPPVEPTAQDQPAGGPTQVEAGVAEPVRQTLSKVLGGRVTAQGARGETVELVVPPFALPQDTEIALTILSKPADGPLPANVFPGLILEPAGLRLRLPSTLTITLANPVPGPAARIFYLKRPGLALPLAGSENQASTLSGKLSHFSTYMAGLPGADEARAQAEAAGNETANFPEGWQDSLENGQGLAEWGGVLDDLGLTEEGRAAFDEARARFEADLACLMDLNCAVVPLDPCGEYLQMLLRYYEQALRFAMDPESDSMAWLEGELTRVLNECTNRYALEYNHKLRVNQGGLEQEFLVTGRVIFNAPIYVVTDAGEPLKVEGSGPVNVIISGQVQADDKTCALTGSATNQVSISGEIQADELGQPQISLQVTETWYTTGSMTFTCPDGESVTTDLPGQQNQAIPLLFAYEDGAEVTAQNAGGMQGAYKWILRILHSW